MYDYVIAVAVISGAISIPEQDKVKFFDKHRISILKVAVELEVLDIKEVGHVFAHIGRFDEDLSFIRERYTGLLDAPPLIDADRFPDLLLVEQYLSFNRAHRECIEIAADAPSKKYEFCDQLQKIDELHSVWSFVKDVKTPYYCVSIRRSAMKSLRNMVGEERYYSGNLPLYVPLEYFNYIP